MKNFVWQQLQIEPSASWRQNLTAEEPCVYHYTCCEPSMIHCYFFIRSRASATTHMTHGWLLTTKRFLLTQDPYIYHYTFGVEYSVDGVPVVGAVGEWSR